MQRRVQHTVQRRVRHGVHGVPATITSTKACRASITWAPIDASCWS
jgi:hypothetical protein